MDKDHVTNQRHQIVLALDLIALKFNGPLNIGLSETVSKASMSIKICQIMGIKGRLSEPHRAVLQVQS